MRGLDSLLSGFLRHIADDPELSLIFLRELWPQLVGEHLARRTRPEKLQGGKLTVAAFSQSWRRELSPLAQSIVHAVNQRWSAPLIDQIEFEFHPME